MGLELTKGYVRIEAETEDDHDDLAWSTFGGIFIADHYGTAGGDFFNAPTAHHPDYKRFQENPFWGSRREEMYRLQDSHHYRRPLPVTNRTG